MHKLKVLFVVTDFYQAGTERFTYEVDAAIDKSLFEISILCYIPLNKSERWDDFYYDKHKGLGSKIYFRKDIDVPCRYTYLQRIKRFLFQKPLPPQNKPLLDFLDQYDVISFMGEYNYPSLELKMTQAHKDKSLLHIMNSKHQNANLYARFDKSKKYHFVSTFEGDVLSEELSEFKDYDHTFMPLAFNINRANFRWSFSTEQKKKIGIFTRLSSHKPINIFLEAFHLLIQKNPSIEFHVFGSGNPKDEGLTDIVQQFELNNHVFFRGHQEDLVETALGEKLDMVWFHGYHGAPGGFAGYDICTTGIPQLFWEFSGKINPETASVFPMFINLEHFVDKSLEVLTQESVAKNISQAQFNYVCEKKDMSIYIKQLEKTYLQKTNRI